MRVNERLAEINGISAAQHIGKTIRELLPDLADAIEPGIHYVLGTGEPTRNIEIAGTTPAQPRVQRSWTQQCLPVKDAAGNVTGLSIVVEEITERKRAEAALEEEPDRLAALVNSIRDEIWFADAAGKFRLVNPSASREFNLDVDAVTDARQFVASLEILRPDGTPRPVDEAPTLRALRGEVVTNQEELTRTPAKGELRYRQVSAAPVRDASGAILGSVSVVRDITELKETADALRRSEARWTAAIENFGEGARLSPQKRSR